MHPAASGGPRPADLPRLALPVADLLDAVRTSGERRMLRRLIDSADLMSPVLVDAAQAAAMVVPYAWLLDGCNGGVLTRLLGHQRRWQSQGGNRSFS